MILGQSAALAAIQAIDEHQTLQEVDYENFRKILQEAGQILEYQVE